MGWNELMAWRREMHRSMLSQQEGERADPESWAGAQHDRWWAEQRARRARERA